MPATPPLPASITNKLKSRNQAARFDAILREVREFRAYCCNVDSSTIMNVSKEPVAILTLSPNPICVGNAMAWDFTGSYSPSSTIVSYAINFGDSNTDSGVSGNHTYATEGEYTVTATVTDGLGVTQTVSQEVNVVDCSSPLLLANIYAATDGSGVWYYE